MADRLFTRQFGVMSGVSVTFFWKMGACFGAKTQVSRLTNYANGTLDHWVAGDGEGGKLGAPMSIRPELIFGFVGPVGVPLDDLVKYTSEKLKWFRYTPIEIRLSKLFEDVVGAQAPTSESEYDRIINGQKIGHQFRKDCNSGAALAIAALTMIRKERERAGESKHPDKPADGVAYLLNQLKHPEEVDLLRKIYGSSFILLAGHAGETERLNTLKQRIASSEGHVVGSEDVPKAQRVIDVDDEEPSDDKFGQNTRNTYPLADFFANFDDQYVRETVDRFIELLFGHPFHSPRPEEVAMYQASASALRSSDESRQVGAVIARIKRDQASKISNIDVVASGMNEVPRRGGGYYWDGNGPSSDARDQSLLYNNLKENRAELLKKDVLNDLIEIFKNLSWLNEETAGKHTANLVKELLSGSLSKSKLMSIGEFQRQVHAEMAALIDSARRGVPVDGLSMYVTTFPCHNCAKHIIAAGLQRVVYLEPYPKSKTKDLYKEEVNTDSKDGVYDDKSEKVIFVAYTGIAPRQYQRLFSMAAKGAKNGMALPDWRNQRETLAPKYVMRNAAASYVTVEREELKNLPVEKFRWNPAVICPD